jgi:solute carrier family 6 noradrenalin transporter-like protein 2
MGGLEAVITGLTDEFKLHWIRREYFTIIILCTSFMGSLINCTQGGGYTMFWFDNYSAGISLLWYVNLLHSHSSVSLTL